MTTFITILLVLAMLGTLTVLGLGPAVGFGAGTPGDPDQGPGQVQEGAKEIGRGVKDTAKAEDQLNGNQSVAIKVPHLEYESDPNFFSRFQREEKIGLQLNHRFILKFIPVENKSRPYIVTEYLKGCTLEHLLKAMRPIALLSRIS